MSSFNPGAKAGYTRTGKSLKSVRRYYALLNQQKPKTPDEDKLSKRIAAELKTQQDANEKRSKRDGGQPLLADVPTERSSLPSGVMISPKETGPVFTPTPKSVNPDPAANKSIKSFKTVAGYAEGQVIGDIGLCNKLIYFLLGLVLGFLLGAAGYMLINKYAIKTNPPAVVPSPRPTYPPTVSSSFFPGA